MQVLWQVCRQVTYWANHHSDVKLPPLRWSSLCSRWSLHWFFLVQTDAICSTTMESSLVMFNPTAQVFFRVPPRVFQNIPPLFSICCFLIRVFRAQRFRFIIGLSACLSRRICPFILSTCSTISTSCSFTFSSNSSVILKIISWFLFKAVVVSSRLVWNSWREKIPLPTFCKRSKNLRPKRCFFYLRSQISILKFKAGSSFICMMQTKQNKTNPKAISYTQVLCHRSQTHMVTACSNRI